MPYPLCHFVYFNVQEVQVLIKVLVFEQAFTNHLGKVREAHYCINHNVFNTERGTLHLGKGNDN